MPLRHEVCDFTERRPHRERSTMSRLPMSQPALKPETQHFYLAVLDILENAGIPFMVGGSYALSNHTQMPRRTKDLDLFVLPADVKSTLTTLSQAGYQTQIAFSHW